MEKNNFLEREQLEQIISNQNYQIEQLRCDRHYYKKFDFVLNVFLSLALFIAFFIVMYHRFKGAIFVGTVIGIVTAYLISESYFCFRRIKTKNEDYIHNDYLKSFPDAVKHISTDSLKVRLSQTIETEEYELTALIRDELKKRI